MLTYVLRSAVMVLVLWMPMQLGYAGRHSRGGYWRRIADGRTF